MRDMQCVAGGVQSDEDVEMVKMVRVWCGVASWVQASWRGGDEGNSWHDLSLQYPARPAHTRVHFFFYTGHRLWQFSLNNWRPPQKPK